MNFEEQVESISLEQTEALVDETASSPEWKEACDLSIYSTVAAMIADVIGTITQDPVTIALLSILTRVVFVAVYRAGKQHKGD